MKNLAPTQAAINGTIISPKIDIDAEPLTTSSKVPPADFYKLDSKKIKITIKFPKLIRLLEQLGFRRLDYSGRILVVRITNNIVKEHSPIEVIDVFDEYLNELEDTLNEGTSLEIPKEALRDKIYKGISTYFSEHLLFRLKRESTNDFIQDSKDCSYLFYKNGAIKIKQGSIELIPYPALGSKKIWHYQIMNRSIEIKDADEITDSVFYKFVQNISSDYRKENDVERVERLDAERFQNLKNIIGYTLHRFFGGKKKAIIFTDSEMGEDANGRTGKTLLAKALGRILNPQKEDKIYVEINGKDFDPKDRFKYQEARRETRLIHINDARKNLNFELLFNDVSEGIKAQRKGAEPFPAEAKIIVSTNQTIRIHGDSAKDRCLEYEMSNYYNKDFSPQTEFGHWLFDDWNAEQWMLFDNFIFICIQDYFTNGLTESSPINLNRRKLLSETAPEFVKYLNKLEKTDFKDDLIEFDKAELHKNFIESFQDFRFLKRRTFTKWCKLYVEYQPDIEKCHEREGGGKYYISFLPTKSKA